MTDRAVRNRWIALAALAGLASSGTARADLWQQAIDRAELLQERQEFAEAKTLLLSALEEASKGPHNELRLAYTLNDLGSLAQDQGALLDAQNYYRRSLGYWEHSGGAQLGMAKTLNNLASLMHTSGKAREARRLLLRSEQLESRKPNLNDADRAVVLLNLGTSYLSQRNYRKAEPFYQRAGAILRRDTQSRSWEVGRVARDLGFICEKTGRKKEAVSYYESAKHTWEECLAAGSITPEMYLDLASLYSFAHQLEQALKTLEAAISQWVSPANLDTPANVSLLTLYAQLLRQLGRKTDAARIETQVREAKRLSPASLMQKTVDVSELDSSPHDPR